jgi:hypothetical protein
LENYGEINTEWGGGYTFSGETVLDFTGRKNKLLTLTLDVALEFNGIVQDIDFSAELPDGFNLSADGIISGIATSNIIGAYNIDVLHDDYKVKTITVNFRITDTDTVTVDVNTVGFKLGNKFLKIVV